MKLLRRSLASLAICSATLALAATPASAAVTLVNAGFETGDTPAGAAAARRRTAYAGFTPPRRLVLRARALAGLPGRDARAALHRRRRRRAHGLGVLPDRPTTLP